MAKMVCWMGSLDAAMWFL